MREVIQDIKRPKRSLKEVLPKEKTAARITPVEIRRVNQSVQQDLEPNTINPPPPTEKSYRSVKRSRRPWVIITTVLGLVVMVVLISSVLAKATVRITPKETSFNLSDELSAQKSNPEKGLRFETMTLESSETRPVKATGTEKVSKKASGKITIYNSFSATSQSLIKETRFESKEGKIYRIDRAVTIPGYKKQGEEIIPGSVEAIIYADKSGPEYNSPVTEFTIPGFRGGPRFTKFSAKSITPLEGGLEGELSIVSPEEKARVKNDTEKILKDRLLGEVKTRIPPGFNYFDSGMFWEFSDSLPANNTTSTEIPFTQTAKLHVLIFNQKELSEKLAKLKLNTDETNILVTNLETLKFELKNLANFDPENTAEINFTLSGEARAVWQVPAEELKTNLSGLSKDGYQSVFAQYPAITRAEVIFRPPWIRHFPEETTKIEVEIPPKP